jgi:hypothetical protein
MVQKKKKKGKENFDLKEFYKNQVNLREQRNFERLGEKSNLKRSFDSSVKGFRILLFPYLLTIYLY